MVDDDHVFIEIEQAPDVEDLPGAAPYLQMVGWGEGAIRAEVCSNTFLDDRFLLSKPQEQQLAELGWNAPTYGRDGEPDSGSPHWWADVELRDADRLAVMCVGCAARRLRLRPPGVPGRGRVRADGVRGARAR